MEVKTGYKHTEVGIIPDDWEVAPLSVLCRSICDGTHFTPRYVTYGIPFYSVENVTANDFDNTKFISDAEHALLVRRCKPERGDILMTRIGSLGDTKLLDWDVNASIYVSLALLKPNERINPEYLYRYSRSRTFVLDVERRSLLNATPKKINMGDIGAIPIPFPRSVQEQRAIAEALADADTLIESLEQRLAKKRQLKQGAMQDLLTGKRRLPGFSGEWEIKRLGDVAEIVMGQSPSSVSYNTQGLGLPLIQGNADIADRQTIRRVFTTALTKLGRAGDILMSVRAPVGEISRAMFDVCLGRGVCAIRYDNDFMYHYLIGQESRWSRLSKGSTFDSVNSADVKALDTCLPVDIDEQTAIAAILSDMDAEIAALEARLAKARQIKQGMMQELLTGRIRLV
jgi:type I restriction enzyme, S subunit